jgi:DNA-binding SARP family transcriptional activator
MLDVSVLGPLEVILDGRSVVPGAGKQRQLLALLALRAERVVSSQELMDELWSERPPRSATTTLQTYVLQLRRRFETLGSGRAGKDILLTRHGGYQLRLDSGWLDTRELERLVAVGDDAGERGDQRTASAWYRRALTLWRGDALVDVPCGPLLQLEVLRLEEAYKATLQRRISADLELGRHTSVVPELRTLVARHPRHEGFAAQLMVALHRSGSPGEALEAFRRLRRALVEELGMEPSVILQSLQRTILDGTFDGSGRRSARAG